MKTMRLSVLLASLVAASVISPGQATGAAQLQRVVQTYPKVCHPGLYGQPNGGAFAVLVFCDDAAGTHIGVVCRSPGERCDSAPWSLDDRFWQQSAWASDVTGFAWDPTGACLYVSTSEVYGSGELYILKLASRSAIAAPLALRGRLAQNGRYNTQIKSLDVGAGKLRYMVEYFDEAKSQSASEMQSLVLTSCGE